MRVLRVEAAGAQHDAHDDHQRMVRLARVLLASWRDAQARAFGWSTCTTSSAARWRCCRDAGAGGLGAAAARCARAPRADRRVPGHQPAAMAGAARLARRRYAGAGGGASGQRRRRVHRRRPQAEHLPLPRRRAARVRGGAQPSSSKASAARVSPATTRGATRRAVVARGQRGVRARRADAASSTASRAHTTESRDDEPAPACGAAPMRRPTRKAGRAARAPSGATALDRAAPRARRGRCARTKRAAWRGRCSSCCARGVAAGDVIVLARARCDAGARGRGAARAACAVRRGRGAASGRRARGARTWWRVLDALVSPRQRPRRWRRR